MDFFDLMSISHRYMEILNPSTSEKIIKLGKLLKLKEGNRVIDFGCGCAEPLIIWAEEFGITGIGIDISSTSVVVVLSPSLSGLRNSGSLVLASIYPRISVTGLRKSWL